MSQVIPEGWLEQPIGNIANVVAGGTPKAGNPNNFAMPGSGIAWLTPADLSKYNSKSISHGARDLSQEGYDSSSAKLMPKGALLFSSRAPIGYVVIAENPICTNQGFKNFVFTEQVDSTYAFYYLKSIRDLAESLGSGTTFKELSGATAKTIPFSLAPLAEQKVIADKLDELLAQVESTKARLDAIPAILKSFRQSVLAAAVSGKLIPSEGSRVATVGKVAQDIRYGTSKKCDYNGGATPVIRIPNIGNRKLDISDLKSANFTDNELDKLALQEGDLLVIRSNGSVELVAKPALVEKQYAGFLFAGYLIRIRCDKELVLPSFLLNVLCSRVVRDVVEIGARSTSGVNNINSKELASLEFVLPKLSEQTEIVRRVEELFAFADKVEAQVNAAQTRVNNLTQSILAKAFRGELTADWRAANPELISGENSAQALLERIKAEREKLKPAKKTRAKKAKV